MPPPAFSCSGLVLPCSKIGSACSQRKAPSPRRRRRASSQHPHPSAPCPGHRAGGPLAPRECLTSTRAGLPRALAASRGGSPRGPAALRGGTAARPFCLFGPQGRELMERPSHRSRLPRFTQAPHRCPAPAAPRAVSLPIAGHPRRGSAFGGQSSTAGPHWTRLGPGAEPRRTGEHWRGWTLRARLHALAAHPAWAAQLRLVAPCPGEHSLSFWKDMCPGPLGPAGWAGLGRAHAPTPPVPYREGPQAPRQECPAWEMVTVVTVVTPSVSLDKTFPWQG